MLEIETETTMDRHEEVSHGLYSGTTEMWQWKNDKKGRAQRLKKTGGNVQLQWVLHTLPCIRHIQELEWGKGGKKVRNVLTLVSLLSNGRKGGDKVDQSTDNEEMHPCEQSLSIYGGNWKRRRGILSIPSWIGLKLREFCEVWSSFWHVVGIQKDESKRRQMS